MTRTGAPLKIAWLLEHQYSPAGLSFTALKNADAARAKVLSQAALRAGCAVHLGIVHIEEYGSADPSYDEYFDRRSPWGRSRYADEDLEDDEETDDAAGGDFEIVEVLDGNQFVDSWVGLDNRGVGFGPIPLDDGELLPGGALDGEKPDSQRVTEATGNEGASFERSTIAPPSSSGAGTDTLKRFCARASARRPLIWSNSFVHAKPSLHPASPERMPRLWCA